MKKVIFFLLFTGVAIGEQYLCVVEKSVGFSYNEEQKEWENTNFSTNFKYVISKADAVWQITRIGESFPIISCKGDFNDYGILLCSDLSDFRLNKRNGRFLHTYPIGYYNVLPGEDEGDNTPYLQIGKCSPF